MTKVAGKSSRYWLDHHNVSGSLNAAEMELTQEAPDATCFEDAGGRVVLGDYRHRHNLRGLFEGSSSNLDAIAHSLIGTTADHYLAELFEGTAEGKVVYESVVQSAGTPIRVSAGAAIVQELPLAGNSGLSRAHVLANGTVGSTTALGNSLDQGASAAGQTYQATFRFFSGTWTNCVLQLEESSNGSTWGVGSTALTATSTGDAKAVRVVTTNATLQYKRVVPTTMAGTDAVVAVTGGVVA